MEFGDKIFDFIRWKVVRIQRKVFVLIIVRAYKMCIITMPKV